MFAARDMIKQSTGWRRALILVGAGLLSVLALAPFFFWPILFLTMPVLVWSIDATVAPSLSATEPRSAIRDAALAGWFFGFGYFFAGLYWIGEAFLVESEKFGWALPFAVTLMPAGLALFWGAAAAAARFFWRLNVSRLLLFAVSLAAAEWLRGHVLTGFPWNLLGYSLTYPLVLMQSASVLSAYGLTLWAALIFPAPLVMATDDGEHGVRRGLCIGGAVAALPLALLAVFGIARLSGAAPSFHEGVRLRIVQPSVPQREKWRPENRRSIFEDLLDLSGRNEKGQPDNLAGISHVVWPEAAMPFLPLEHPEAQAAIGEMLPAGTFLISGALRREKSPPPEPPARARAFNSLMVFDADGSLTSVYDKIHLVPFGEYLPAQSTLEAIGLRQLTQMRGGFTVGAAPRPLVSIGGTAPPVLGLICYEALFPGEIVEGTERPGFLINVTNDGWFGNSIGPRQHFHQARVRAVEEGIPIVRAANHGISAVIDAHGAVEKTLNLNDRGVIDSRVPASVERTFYAKFGDLAFAVSVLFFLATVLCLGRRGRS
jgi:apolipoprotein N-acyltransferase